MAVIVVNSKFYIPRNFENDSRVRKIKLHISGMENKDYAQTLIDGMPLRNELSNDYEGPNFEMAEAQLRTETYPALRAIPVFFTQQLNAL